MRSPKSDAFHLSNSILLRLLGTLLKRMDDVINIVPGIKRQSVYLIVFGRFEAPSSATRHVILSCVLGWLVG